MAARRSRHLLRPALFQSQVNSRSPRRLQSRFKYPLGITSVAGFAEGVNLQPGIFDGGQEMGRRVGEVVGLGRHGELDAVGMLCRGEEDTTMVIRLNEKRSLAAVEGRAVARHLSDLGPARFARGEGVGIGEDEDGVVLEGKIGLETSVDAHPGDSLGTP